MLREQATEVRIAEDEKARTALWYGRLHAPDSVVHSGKGFFIGDVTVPRQRIPEMQEAIQAAAARHTDGLLFIAVCGHAGDGDLHPTTFFDKDNPKAAAALEAANNEIIDAALGMGGTITGEHGVGTEKRQFMTKRFTPVEIAAQRAIKKAFDPAGLLNPGIMLPDFSPEEPTIEQVRRRRSRRPHRQPRNRSGGAADGRRQHRHRRQSRQPQPGRRRRSHPRAHQPLPRRARRHLRRHPIHRRRTHASANWLPPPPAMSGSTSGTLCSGPT